MAVDADHSIVALVTLPRQANLIDSGQIQYKTVRSNSRCSVAHRDLCIKLKMVSNFHICLGVGIIV